MEGGETRPFFYDNILVASKEHLEQELEKAKKRLSSLAAEQRGKVE